MLSRSVEYLSLVCFLWGPLLSWLLNPLFTLWSLGQGLAVLTQGISYYWRRVASALNGTLDYKGTCEVLGEERPGIVYCANARAWILQCK